MSTPGDLLNGEVAPIAAIPADLGNVGTAVSGLVSGLHADLSSGAVLQNPVGDIQDIAQGLATIPVASLANGVIDSAHGDLEGATDALLPGTVHAVTGLGNAVGLGEIGGDNALTHVLSVPDALMSGDVTPVAALPGDVANVADAASGLVSGVAADAAGSIVDAALHPLTGSGILAGDLPGQGITDAVATPVTAIVDEAGSALGVAPVTAAATDLANSLGHTVTDVLHGPSDIVGGAIQAATPVDGDVAADLSSAATLVASAASEASHMSGAAGDLATTIAPVSGTLSGLDGALSHGDITGAPAPLTSALGSGAPLSAVTGALSGASSDGGSHDLATVAIGPSGSANAANIDLIGSTSTGQTHVVDVHAASAPQSVPTLANVGLLSGDSIHVPTLAGGGADALSGVVSGTSSPAAAPAATDAVHTVLDIGVAHADLPILHADPLTNLVHAVDHHA